MRNVAGRDGDVKRGAPGAGGPPDVAALPVGRAALEIARLLEEVGQVERAGRRGSGVSAGGVPAEALAGQSGDPVASHVVRAAIHIYADGPRTIGQLATELGISQGWASRVVDEMERAGYVERERDAADRRVVRVRLAPAAVERVERAYRWRGDAVEAALEGTSAEERAAVAAFLRRFVDAARAGG